MKRILSIVVLSTSFLSISAQTVLKPTTQDLQVVLDSLDAVLDNTAMHESLVSVVDTYFQNKRQILQGLAKDFTSEEKQMYLFVNNLA